MAVWTATINSVGPDSAGIAVSVTFSSSDQPPRTLLQVFHFQNNTTDDVNNSIQNQINILEAQDAIVSGIQPGSFTPSPPPTPSAQQIALVAYQQALAIRQSVQAAIASGAITSGSPDDVSSLALIQQAYPLAQNAVAIMAAQTTVTNTALPANPSLSVTP